MKLFSLSLFIGIAVFASAQELLQKEAVVQQVLEKHFGVQMAENKQQIADNNTSILNSGFLPKATATAGANYNLNNIVANRQDGSQTTLNGAASSAYNAGLGLNYTLFDGLGRWYNYKQLKDKYALSELESRLTIENAVLQTLQTYYDVALKTHQMDVSLQALDISKKRIDRTQSAFEYGQGNKLNVLNAQVDIANDSMTLSNAYLALNNAKKNLNALLQEDIERNFNVDTTLQINTFINKESLYKSLLEKNASLIIAKQNMELASYNKSILRANYLPKINTNVNYGWNRSNNNAASFLASSISYGLNAGATLSWTIFDGGSTKVAMQNNELNTENLNLQYLQTQNDLTRNFELAWADYQQKLDLLNLQNSNLLANENNFNRTKEMFALGQVSSIEFRQAQQNLLYAALQINQIKYQVKMAELQLYYLAGTLLDIAY